MVTVKLMYICIITKTILSISSNLPGYFSWIFSRMLCLLSVFSNHKHNYFRILIWQVFVQYFFFLNKNSQQSASLFVLHCTQKLSLTLHFFLDLMHYYIIYVVGWLSSSGLSLLNFTFNMQCSFCHWMLIIGKWLYFVL